MKQLLLSDFDGTLTTHDTLPAFIHYACGWKRMAIGFLIFSPILILMKLGFYPNWKAKQRLFGWFFGSMEIDRFNALCSDFAAENAHLLRPEMAQIVAEAVQRHDRVAVVSASIDNWVAPFFGDGIQVIGTQIEVKDGHVTGKFKTNNCYGPEKVNRIRQEIGLEPRNELLITAYGDSRGDREMLALADRAFKVMGNGQIRELQSVIEKPSATAQTYGEIIRFGIVGLAATALQYGVYLLCLPLLARLFPAMADNPLATTANTVGYIISFVFNFIASTRYTFRVKANARRGAGFALSHVVNYLLQTATLNLFILLGLSKQVAMLPMFCVCVPINFLLVRFFLKRK